ncbi:MAG: peptidoglycan DL-endopeptidase RipB [bacterium]|jgi:peptidoglycan hydrolase CwlO-like protein
MTTTSLRRLLLICALTLSAATGVTFLATAAGADLSSKISAKQNRADALRAAVAAESAKIRSSSAGLATAQRRLRAIQADANAQQAKLDRIERALTKARDRLTRLVARQHQATDALRANLLAAYRNPQPDIVSVVIEAKGFADLLEKADFLKRIGKQQARIMDGARTSRVAVTKQASALATMQARALRIAEALTARRDRAQTLETALLREQQRQMAGRAAKAGELQDIAKQLAALRKRLARSARNGIRTAPGGMAQAPPGAPAAVGLVIAAGNAIAGLPYLYGGGHSGFRDTAYDCSGSVSYALAAAGLVNSPMASGPFMSWGQAGPGKWITVYANYGHAYMVVAGWRFDTSNLGTGTRWSRTMRSNAGFVARHPPGL